MPLTPLETERLLIRDYVLDDLQARHRLMTEAFGSHELMEDTRDWLEWTVRNYRELARLYQPPYGDYVVALKSSGEVIGSVGLVPSVVAWDALAGNLAEDAEPLLSPEFGLFWAMLPEHQGMGYAPEAASAFVRRVFLRLAPRRLVATTEFDNPRSQRVMQKLGMQIFHNPGERPFWLQVIGVLEYPGSLVESGSS